MKNDYTNLGELPSKQDLINLGSDRTCLAVEGLKAGYGKMEIIHNLDLYAGEGQSLCLIGPNGAGKSTVLHSVFGFTDIYAGTISVAARNITYMSSAQKLKTAGVAYIMQENSVFPNMTVEENLLMGAYLIENNSTVRTEIERIFSKYDRLNQRRHQPAKVLSGGERRLLEISRALVMKPTVLLVDEPSIGLEPRYIDMVFEILQDLKENEGKTIILVEQNATKGLQFADIGYVMSSGVIVMADHTRDLLKNKTVGKLFLGG